MKKKFNRVYEFKISLVGIRPQIWRAIQIPETYSFWDLHVAIQDAMGWEDEHLHKFEVTEPLAGFKVNIGIPSHMLGFQDSEYDENLLPEYEEKIADYFSMENRSAVYIYDFGDTWVHKILFRKILQRKEGVEYPVCVGGRRACPPEDCGGVWGYYEMLEIIKNPGDERYEEMMKWLGGKFDPEYFNIKEVKFDDPDKRFKEMFG